MSNPQREQRGINMNTGEAISIIRQVIYMSLYITGIVMIPCFIVGLLVSIFQATTQIQEQTLTFVPKIVITFIIIIFCGNYFVYLLSHFFANLLLKIPLL